MDQLQYQQKHNQLYQEFTPTVIDADVGGTITITGQNFASIPKSELQRANGAFQSATSVTFTSATTISFTTGTAGLTNGQNVRILVTNPDGNAARSGTDLVVSDGPVFKQQVYLIHHPDHLIHKT